VSRQHRIVGRSDWAYAIRRTGHSFARVRGWDSAASLTFFSALTLFPAALAVMSALAVVDGSRAVGFVLQVVDEIGSADMVETIRRPLEQFTNLGNPGGTFLVGFALTLWTGSAYTTAFGRAVNTLYGVQEGRRIWKFRSLMLAVTLLLTVGMAAALLLLFATPRVAAAAGRVAGIGEPWVTLWNVARWPALLLLAAALIAMLYYFTPTVDRETAPWFSAGAVLALAGWTLGTAGFWLYITGLAHYDELYGWAGGAVVVLLWLFLSNLVLVLGAGLDAELTRVHHLRAGIPSESTIRVPMRDTSRNLVLARSLARDEADGRAIREESEALLEAGLPVVNLPVPLEAVRRRLSAMNERDAQTPDEAAVEGDFSTPADPDLRGSGTTDYTTPGEPITDDEHSEAGTDEESVARRITPGNPIEES
jgi:membrane protein